MKAYRTATSATGALTLLFAFGIGFAAETARADGGNSTEVEGTLASTQVVGAACPSPIGLCTQGTLTGGLRGTFFYTAESLIVLPDGITGVFDGTVVLQTPKGVVTEHDHTIANLQTGQLADVQTILSGTGAWTGATGTIQVYGSFNFATGVGASRYEGTIFFPQDQH
jgi:hypothetical protein